jgi:hypothetical protein
MNEEHAKSMTDAPMWAKPFMAADDIARVGADNVTMGYLDKMLEHFNPSSEEGMKTKAARSRMGSAAPAVDVGSAAAMLPSLVPRGIGYLGGGALARGITGITGGAAEGGVMGGISATGHDRPDAPVDTAGGVGWGAAGGTLGQALSPLTTKVSKWWQGIDDSVPAGIRSKMMQAPKGQKATPSAADKVNFAANTAESRAAVSDKPFAVQQELKDAFEKLLRKDPKPFNKEQKSLMEKISTKEDPATSLSRKGADMLGNKLAMATMSVGGGAGGGGLTAMLGIPAAMSTGSKLLGKVSEGGTKEALDDLKRAMAGKSRYKGILSQDQKAALASGVRQPFISRYDEEY